MLPNTNNHGTTRLLLNLLTSVCIGALTLVALTSLSAEAAGPTPVPGGTLTADTVWTSAGSPYLVNGNIVVDEEVTLTVEAGVVVRFDATRLTVRGNLSVQGTAEHPVVFTSAADTPQPGDWYALRFQGGSSAMLKHCEIAFAGRSGLPALQIEASLVSGPAAVTVRNCAIHDNADEGIFLSGSGLDAHLDTVHVHNNGGDAIRHSTPNLSMHYRHLTLDDNGTGAVIIPAGSITGDRFWALGEVEAPVHVTGSVSVSSDDFLTLEPGTTLQFGDGVRLAVRGNFYALGTMDQTITLRGMSESPGAWEGVDIRPDASALLRQCDLGYGGQNGEPLLGVASSAVVVRRCRVHHSAAEGVEIWSQATPMLTENQIVDNQFGMRNATPDTPVDARQNWWGDPSGPFHAMLNPDGQGNAVSDGVQFEPWLQAPDPSTAQGSDLVLQLIGPASASSGQTVDYVAEYTNNRDSTLEDAVLVMALPAASEFVGSSMDGIYWPQRHQVFWRLGDLIPGATGRRYLRIRYNWGLPEGLRESTVTVLSGSNLDNEAFDVQPYLDYDPVVVAGGTPLDAQEVEAERSQYADLETLYTEYAFAGYVFGGATRYDLSDGSQVLQIVLLDLDTSKVAYLWRQDSLIWASVYGPNEYTLRDVRGGITFDPNTAQYVLFGEWQTGQTDKETATPQACELGDGECMFNCIVDKIPLWLVARKIKIISSVLTSIDCFSCRQGDGASCIKCGGGVKDKPIVGEMVDVKKCYGDCTGDDPFDREQYCCDEDKIACKKDFFLGFEIPGRPVQVRYICKRDVYVRREETLCGFRDEKCICVEDKGCKCCSALDTMESSSTPFRPLVYQATPTSVCGLLQNADDACSGVDTDVEQGKDPNRKTALSGSLVPGQVVTYTISYANEGEGRAFGVFVTDQLSEHFDESTLQIYGGSYLSTTRSLAWPIGELAEAGMPASSGTVSFTVRLKEDVPDGTEIINQAVVYFPSVPEETPTNATVNMVGWPAAVPQTVETVAGTPISITLQSRHVGENAPSFVVVDQPLFGQLQGTPPSVIYAPQDEYIGADSFAFTVNQDGSTSRPARVDIVVRPSPADTIPPDVRWTSPSDGATHVSFTATSLTRAPLAPTYAPYLSARFSEPLQVASINDQTVRLVQLGNGKAISTSVAYDGTANQVVLTLHEPLQSNTQYEVQLGTGIQDLAGNGLDATTWAFQTAGEAASPAKEIYIPWIQR